MEIEVGENVRTKNGKIDKVKNNNYYMQQYIECEKGLYLRDNITKHSFNLIDLIEVGDYVNGNIVTDKYLFAGEKPVIETERNDTNCKCLCEKDIKSILTHEQFEANCYKVKGE